MDPHGLIRDTGNRAPKRLQDAWSEVPWGARDHAAVHIWYTREFGGGQIELLLTIADAAAT
jgi:hypothetical protein